MPGRIRSNMFCSHQGQERIDLVLICWFGYGLPGPVRPDHVDYLIVICPVATQAYTGHSGGICFNPEGLTFPESVQCHGTCRQPTEKHRRHGTAESISDPQMEVTLAI